MSGCRDSRSSGFRPGRSSIWRKRSPVRLRPGAKCDWRSTTRTPVGSTRSAPRGRSMVCLARFECRRLCLGSTLPRCCAIGLGTTRAHCMSGRRYDPGDTSRQPPLSGIRVLEVGNYMAAPFCGMQLADLGAEVIKVENPEGGDQVRLSAPLVEGEGSAFMRLNRNKRSIALDLKTGQGKDIFRKLLATADVVVENLRPGTMNDLGLEYETLRLINPGLVYVAASGWGQDGPLRDQPGMDIMAQARSGLMSITGTAEGDPVKIGVPICDLVCALYGALAAVAALYARRESGVGQYIDVSLFEAGVSFAIWEAGIFFATGDIPRPSGSAHQSAAPYQAFRAADGWLTIGATTKFNWIALCRALGLDSLLDDKRYVDSNLRHRNREALA